MEEFINRLNKVNRHVSKWARKQGVTCYRIYDDDLTNFPFVIDRYEHALHVAEYQRKHNLSEEEHELKIQQCLAVMAEVLEVQPHDVHLKERRRQKGLNQYQKVDSSQNRFLVQENGLSFLVNLSDYLDTGLFLDHRNTRQLVRDQAQGKRFLNLFAYTGAFTVYAIAGGASETVTVDLSNTYLDWAKSNLAANGWAKDVDKKHHFVKADVKDFLFGPNPGLFDLVVVDPPTFSNSKMMDDIFDVQRDHIGLLNQVLRLTAPGGIVYFSTNQRSFKLQTEEIRASKIENISGMSVPQDFRDKKIHQCFRILR
jgi:23S rRNA (cytosine1962-C5)-methyltransferase